MRQIYVHGLGQTPASWDKTISYLKDRENSICPDLARIIGHGEASYENLYRAFSDVCDEAGEPVDLCGLSLGGILALHYAAEHAEKVNSLVLIAAQYKMPKRMLRLQNIIFRFMPGSMFAQTGFGKSEFITLCKTMMELDFSTALARISCPVLVVCGEKDGANKKASAELAGILQNAEFREVEGAGHEINTEAPEQLARLLGEFRETINGDQTHRKE